MPSRSHVERVLHALGTHLAAAGLIDWDGGRLPGTGYTDATEWPTVLGPNMPPRPARLLVLTPSAAAAQRGNVLQGIQVRARGDVDSPVWDVLDKLQEIADHFTPGGIPRSSFVMGDLPVSKVVVGPLPQPLADDAERRPGATMTLMIHARRIAPTTARPVPPVDGPELSPSPDHPGYLLLTGSTPSPAHPGYVTVEVSS